MVCLSLSPNLADYVFQMEVYSNDLRDTLAQLIRLCVADGALIL